MSVELWKNDKCLGIVSDRVAEYIEKLEARIEALKAALRPFAESPFDVQTYREVVIGEVTIGDVRAARAALAGGDE